MNQKKQLLVNTIIIAIAYDSNKQTDIINFMNNLGY